MTAPVVVMMRPLVDRCLACEHPIVAMTPDAVNAGITDHVVYVNTVLDRTIDIHFEPSRLDRLIS